MVDMSTEFEGDYLSAKDYEEGEALALTIKGVSKADFKDHEDESITVRKVVVHFNEKKPGLVLNRTNGRTLIGLYGKDSDGWLGKPVSILVSGSGVGPWFKIREKVPKVVEAKL